MKILHIADIIPSNPANGITEVLKNLIPHQRALGHDVACGILLQEYSGIYENEQYFDFSNLKKFKLDISHFQPDIVIFHSLYYFRYAQYAKFLDKVKIPYVIQFHGGASYQNYQKKRLFKYLYRKAFVNDFVKKASGLIYLNSEELDSNIFKSFNSKSAIIPNGVTIHKNIEKNDSELIRFVFIGRIDIHQKGLDVLFEGLRMLSPEIMKNCSFDFYGPYPPKKFLDWINELSNCSYKGATYGNNKIKVLKQHDIFILTSRYEGMPMSILEALACGLPCLITPATNMANVITKGQAGWITEFDSLSIARAIEKAVTDFKREKKPMIDNTSEIAQSYSWKKIAELSVGKYEYFLGL